MPKIEQEEAILSDIVMAFSLMLVAICRSLEEQQHVLHEQFINRLNLTLAMEQVQIDSNVKNILANFVKGLEGKGIEPVHFQQ